MPLVIGLLILALLGLWQERKAAARRFIRSRILSVLDALDVGIDRFPYYDVAPYVLSCLDEYDYKYSGTKRHSYSRQDGLVYSASPSDPVAFVFVCVGRYAVDYENSELRDYCDRHIAAASRADTRLGW